MSDIFEALSAQLDTLTENLPPEKISMARGDAVVRQGMSAQREVQTRRGIVAQDRVTRIQRDQLRNQAVRDCMLQGKTEEEAEALVASYSGPRSPLPVPDPKTVQPTEAEAQALRAAAARLEAILADDYQPQPDPHGGQMGPAPTILVTPGSRPAVALTEG